MGSSTLRLIGLAAIVLLCLWPAAEARKRAQGVESTLVWSPDQPRAPSGVFANITGLEEYVFVVTRPQSPVSIIGYEVNALLGDLENLSPAYLANSSELTGSDSEFSEFSTTDGNYIYFSTSTSYYRANPQDLLARAQVIRGFMDTQTVNPPMLPLVNMTTGATFVVGGGIGGPNQAAGYHIIQDDMWASGSTDLSNALKFDIDPLGTNFRTSCRLSDTYGYLVSASDYSVMLWRVTGSDAKPDLAIALYDVSAGSNYLSCAYNMDTNVLYLAATNSTVGSGLEGSPILVALNLTLADPMGTTGLTLNQSLAALTEASAASQVEEIENPTLERDDTSEMPVRVCAIVLEDAVVPAGFDSSALILDIAGGQAFVTVVETGIQRINLATMRMVYPSFGMGEYLSGGLYVSDAANSAGSRKYFSFLSASLTRFEVATACPNDCGEAAVNGAEGHCVAGVCECAPGRHGEDCSGIMCQSDCGEPLGRGRCALSGNCICEPNWSFASNCTQRQCPSNCFGNGVCDTSTFRCTCNSLWAGVACEKAAFLACPEFTTEKSCVEKLGACGWCADTKKCVTGNLDGPYIGSCRAWYTGGRYQVGLLIAAIIVIVIFFLMLLVGIFSAMPIDYVTASILVDPSLLTTDFVKEAYSRDERSAKTWKMFELFQFISFYTFINVSLPTQIVQFSRYFNWANLMLPLPYGYEDNKTRHANRLPGNQQTTSGAQSIAGATAGVAGARTLLNAEQYANSVKVSTEHIFYGTMFWFAMLVCAVLLVYAIYALIMWLCLRKKEPFIATLLRQKVFHILTRLVLIGYMPINFTAAWHIREGARPHMGSIAAAIIAIIVFGILPIVFNAVVVWNKGKELLFLFLKLRFGALYAVFHYEKARFHLIVLIKKLAISLLLGFIAAPSTTQGKYVYAQVFTIVAVYVLYAIVAIIIRAYLDQVHLVVDLIMSFLFALAFGIAVLHKNSPSTAGQIVWGVCIIIVFLACLLSFFHSWYNINGRNTYPCIMCGPKYGGLDENDGEAELDAAQQIRQKKEKEAALAGVMPSNKPGAAAHDEPSDDEDVDSSLQSSSEEEEDDSESEQQQEEEEESSAQESSAQESSSKQSSSEESSSQSESSSRSD